MSKDYIEIVKYNYKTFKPEWFDKFILQEIKIGRIVSRNDTVIYLPKDGFINLVKYEDPEVLEELEGSETLTKDELEDVCKSLMIDDEFIKFIEDGMKDRDAKLKSISQVEIDNLLNVISNSEIDDGKELLTDNKELSESEMIKLFESITLDSEDMDPTNEWLDVDLGDINND